MIAIEMSLIGLSKCKNDKNYVEDETDDAEKSKLLDLVVIALKLNKKKLIYLENLQILQITFSTPQMSSHDR